MRTRQTFSASNACEPRCSQCRPTDQRCPVGCMAAATVRRDACRNLHPTSSPTTSRSPSVLGRSDRTESLDGSVISFVLLHRRLLKVNPLSCGAATMLHTWPTRHQMAEVVSMRLSLQHVQVRPERPSNDPTDNFSSCQSPSCRPSAMDI